jgi:hypothetical protein
MRIHLLGFMFILAACGSRTVQGEKDAAPAADARKPDAASVADASTPDASTPDAPPQPTDGGDAFCQSADPRAVIVGERELQVVVETGTTMTNCCTGEQIRFVPHPAISELYEIHFSILRFPEAAPVGDTTRQIDLRSPPEGWLFTLYCNPYELCNVPSSPEITGTLTIHGPEVGRPGYRASLCATLQATAAMTKQVRVVANQVWINTACTFGMDQTCNENPLISSLRGTCQRDGTCVCQDAKAPSGRCL